MARSGRAAGAVLASGVPCVCLGRSREGGLAIRGNVAVFNEVRLHKCHGEVPHGLSIIPAHNTVRFSACLGVVVFFFLLPRSLNSVQFLPDILNQKPHGCSSCWKAARLRGAITHCHSSFPLCSVVLVGLRELKNKTYLIH